MLEQIQTVQPDWIYLNGALPPLTRDFLHLRQKDATIQKIPTLLAPHGNLSKYALAHHRIRKQAWLLYAKWRKLYSGVTWHAASDREADQVRAIFGAQASIREVPMAPRAPSASDSESVGKLPVIQKAPLLNEEGWAAQRVGVVPSAISDPPADLSHHSSQRNTLSLVYFGRLSPEKNLPFAFLLLKQFAQAHPDQAVVYDLIGAGEPRYEAKLLGLAARLPATVQVNFVGQLSPEALQSRLQSPASSLKSQVSGLKSSHLPTFPLSHLPRYCAMLMPSLTENFSYTVLESLQAGIPVLISDQTPWRDLQSQGVGWDLSLEDPDRWLQALEDLVRCDFPQRQMSSQHIQDFASCWGADYQRKAEQLFGSR
jgi:glycosyltransferase involved in cell wall biosynthesis